MTNMYEKHNFDHDLIETDIHGAKWQVQTSTEDITVYSAATAYIIAAALSGWGHGDFARKTRSMDITYRDTLNGVCFYNDNTGEVLATIKKVRS